MSMTQQLNLSWLPEEVVAAADKISGWFSVAEMRAYAALIRHFVGPSGTAVEVGSWLGRSSYVAAWACQEVSARLVCVDTWAGSPSEDEANYTLGQDEAYSAFLENLKEFPATMVAHKGLSSDVAKALDSYGPLSLVFLDGDHTTKGVLNDIDSYRPKIVRGGAMCGHDYGRAGVASAVNARFGSRHTTVPDTTIWYAVNA